MPKSRGPMGAVEARQAEVERVHKSGAQYFKITGEIEVVGPGEVAFSVNFPLLFVEKPAFSFGPELAPGQPIEIGNMPECSVVCIAWDERVRDDGSIIYVGAQLAIVSKGPADQVMLIQWHMEGIGLRGPYDEDVDD